MSAEAGGVDDEDEGSQVVLPPRIVSDDEACRQLNQEELLARVRKMNDDLEATQIPLHDVPVALVVQALAREKTAASWSRLCQEGGRPSVAAHIRRVVRTTTATTTTTITTTTNNPSGSDYNRLRSAPPTFRSSPGQRRALTWEAEYPRCRYRANFKPPVFEDEPSDSSDDEEARATGGG